MRISVLRTREAFADILAATLSRFWAGQFETEFALSWSPAHNASVESGQMWLCNDYLNCLFLPGTARASFEPIRREYSRSVQRWRTPFQQAYVATATHPLTSRWLAQAALLVRPAVPTRPEQIVVPGNAKVRLISATDKTTWVTLKDGFAKDDFMAEVKYRTSARAAGVPVPEIEHIDERNACLRERYITGTPTNRIPGRAAQLRAVQAGYAAIFPLIESTLQQTTSAEYSSDLARRFDIALSQLENVASQTRNRLRVATEALLAKAQLGPSQIACAQTHGDFQPGNVLADGDTVWIIDWEYAGYRMASYDPLVMGLASRFSSGLADRMHGFIEHGPRTNMGAWPSPWPASFGENRGLRTQLAAFFLVEELLLHVKENARPPVRNPGQGLLEMLQQAEAFLIT